MPHLLAPAAHGDRPTGGRHGRPGGRSRSALVTPIRTRLLRLALVPATVITLCCWTAVLGVLSVVPGRPGPGCWALVTGAALVTLAAQATAAAWACRTADALRGSIAALRSGTARRHAELVTLVDSLRHGEDPSAGRPTGPATAPQPADPTATGSPATTPSVEGANVVPAPSLAAPGARRDEFALLSGELVRAHDAAVTAVVQAARMRRGAAGTPHGRSPGTEAVRPAAGMFVPLARRMQVLAQREIALLDELENRVEDPDLLDGLFCVDQLATRVRRHAESLAALGGCTARRRWSRPVPVVEVLRSAMAEVEQYPRVRLVPPTDGTVRGHAVTDVIHLLAELIENATAFSAPHTLVLLRVAAVTSGLAVEVEDRGPGIPAPDRARANLLLAEPDRADLAAVLRSGRIGLYVASRLARRHGVSVRLQANIYGGTQAVLILPRDLLGTDRDVPATAPLGSGTDTTAAPAAAAHAAADAPTGGRHPGAPAGFGKPPVPGPVRTTSPSRHAADEPAHAHASAPASGARPAAAPAPSGGVPTVTPADGASAPAAGDPGATPPGGVPVPAGTASFPGTPPAGRDRDRGRPRLPRRVTHRHPATPPDDPAARQAVDGARAGHPSDAAVARHVRDVDEPTNPAPTVPTEPPTVATTAAWPAPVPPAQAGATARGPARVPGGHGAAALAGASPVPPKAVPGSPGEPGTRTATGPEGTAPYPATGTEPAAAGASHVSRTVAGPNGA